MAAIVLALASGGPLHLAAGAQPCPMRTAMPDSGAHAATHGNIHGSDMGHADANSAAMNHGGITDHGMADSGMADPGTTDSGTTDPGTNQLTACPQHCAPPIIAAHSTVSPKVSGFDRIEALSPDYFTRIYLFLDPPPPKRHANV